MNFILGPVLYNSGAACYPGLRCPEMKIRHHKGDDFSIRFT